MDSKEDSLFSFLLSGERERKPRKKGITEIRGSYYTVAGPRYLADVLECMHPYIDSLKFAGGAFSLFPDKALADIISLCHKYDVLVSTGGFIEYALTKGKQAADQYIAACKEAGFDIIELSSGFISLSGDDWMQLMDKVQSAGLKAKPEVGIQFGAGGSSDSAQLQEAGTRSPEYAVKLAKRFIEAGAYLVMVESEGITENVEEWRADVPALFIDELGTDKLMFEAADPAVFQWYIKSFGPDVNLFVDHSQIIQLECLRQGLWGTQDLWGRVVRY
jgi:phosphosulfolactate synthase (CoM biosynthesis protein A)